MPDLSLTIANRSIISRSFEEAQQTLNSVRDKAHILTPFARTAIPIIPDGWQVYFHSYIISTKSHPDAKGNPVYDDGELYPIKGTGRLGLTKIGVWRLEQLAGVTWEDPRTGASTIHRIDDGKDSHVCQYQATAYIRDLDGQIRSSSDGHGYDLRNGSPQALAMSEKELPKARQNIEQLTITKCKLRVLRSILGIQTSYTLEDLKKPFVVLKMNFNIDGIDPAIKEKLYLVLAAKQMGIEKELFGMFVSKAEQLLESATNPEVPPSMPPVETPLELPPITDPIQPTDDAGLGDIGQEHERADQITRIENLYLIKKGMTRSQLSPEKLPLKDLPDMALNEIETALRALTDLPKPPDVL